MNIAITRIFSCATLALAVCLLLPGFSQPARAAITTTGDVDPPDPGSWTLNGNTEYCIGKTADGTLVIDNDSDVSSGKNFIGRNSGATGVATVEGTGSTWTTDRLYVGAWGSGTLNIISGGIVDSFVGRLGYTSDTTSIVNIDGIGSTWTLHTAPAVGESGKGTLNISNGGKLTSTYNLTKIGYFSGSTGIVNVDGIGSTWSCTRGSTFHVGYSGNGTMNITSGAAVNSYDLFIGYSSGSSGVVTVDGIGSTWTNSYPVIVGYQGNGTLNIVSGGLVSVGGTLTIDHYMDGDSFINMATGGMLSLLGDGDDSLDNFLGRIEGTDAIRYWDDSIDGWSQISNATFGEDYTLEYMTDGDLAGYTVLTVGTIPEPSGMTLLCLGALGLLSFARRRK